MSLNGKKLPKQQSGKQKIKELETSMQNAQMATQVTQMMLKQVLEQFQGLRSDVDNTMGILNDFQYRSQAMLKLGNFDIDELNKYADELKLTDYMKASDAEDESKGYLNDDKGTIEEDSVIIITSSTNDDEDKGIFRSKFSMTECHTDSLKENLLGKKVGDKVEEEINGDTHTITVVGLRKPTVQEETAPEGSNAESN